MLLVSNFSPKNTLLLSMAIVGSFSLMGCSQPTLFAKVDANTQQSLTLKNLQTSYNGESNAHHLYLASAKKAEEEGYKGVASLFKAAAMPEEIHRDNHAKVITQMGGNLEDQISSPVVKSTQKNLENVIKGESYEQEEMYPQFIKEAQAEGKKDAIQTFTYASTAEAEHAQLYRQALQNLQSWKSAKEFYICPLSGTTTITATQNSYSTADGIKQKLEKIS